MTERIAKYDASAVEDTILTIRGQKVILDSDLAAIYGVEVRRLNEQVKRNSARFPEDFAFKLTAKEWEELRRLRSQNATLKRGQHRKYLPYVFTEHGAIMAANVLNSRRAVTMSVFVVRAFVKMRQALLTRHEMEKRLDQIEKLLLVHDNQLQELYRKIRPLLLPPEPPKKEIGGFKVKEKRACYRTRKKRGRNTRR